MAKQKLIDTVLDKNLFRPKGLILSDDVRSFHIQSDLCNATVGGFEYLFDIGDLAFQQPVKIVGFNLSVPVSNGGFYKRVIGGQLAIQANGVSLSKLPRVSNNLVQGSITNYFVFDVTGGNNYIPCEIEIEGNNMQVEFNVFGIDTIAGIAGDQARVNLTVFYREYK